MIIFGESCKNAGMKQIFGPLSPRSYESFEVHALCNLYRPVRNRKLVFLLPAKYFIHELEDASIRFLCLAELLQGDGLE